MKRHEVEIGGANVYWSLGWTSRPALEMNLKALRLEAYTPNERTESAVLHQTLSHLFGGPTTIIRRLKDKSGFAIVSERRGEDHNEYKHERAVRVENRLVTCDDPATDVWEIQSKFDELSSLLSPSCVSACLVEIVTKVLGGVPLRESGGLYWVPESTFPRLEAIAHAVENACVPGANNKDKSTVYMMETVKNENCIVAVRDAIENEIAKRIEAIDQEVAEGTLGERALESRKEEAIQLRHKLAMYEKELGCTMEALAEQVDRVRAAAGTAMLLAAARAAGNAEPVYTGDLDAVLSSLSGGA